MIFNLAWNIISEQATGKSNKDIDELRSQNTHITLKALNKEELSVRKTWKLW